jgi:hypothetical protein
MTKAQFVIEAKYSLYFLNIVAQKSFVPNRKALPTLKVFLGRKLFWRSIVFRFSLELGVFKNGYSLNEVILPCDDNSEPRIANSDFQ